jgi:hypothetical protein
LPTFIFKINMIKRLFNTVLISAIAIQLAIAPIKSAYAFYPLVYGVPLAMRIGAPLSTTAFRWLVMKVGQTTASSIASAELHAWLGAIVLGITFAKPSNPLATDVPKNASPIDGPIVWLDNVDQSKFVNPDPARYTDASPASPDKQPTPKTTGVDMTAGYPANPTTFPKVVQDWSGGPTGWALYKGTSGSRTQSVMTKYWYVNADIALSTTSALNRCASSASIKPSEAPGTSANWCNYVSVNGAPSEQYAVWQQTILVPCAAGYTQAADGSCSLTNATAVTKPANQQCEYIKTSTGWTADPKNPNCAAYASKITRPTLTSIEIKDGQRADNASMPTLDEVISDDVVSGNTTIVDNDPTGTRYVATIGTNGNGQRVITGLNTTGGSTTAVGTPATTNTNSGTSTGTSTGIGGFCGGVGQPACSMDDAGFDGKTMDISAVKQKLDSAAVDFNQRIQDNSNNPHGITKEAFFSSFRFGMPQSFCQNPDLDFGHGFSLNFDICGNVFIQMIRQFEAWFLYCFTMYYIWRRFMSAEQVQAV